MPSLRLPLLLFLCLFLGWLVWLDWTSEGDDDTNRPAAKLMAHVTDQPAADESAPAKPAAIISAPDDAGEAQLPPELANPLAAMTPADFDAITSRPLFSPTRRPPRPVNLTAERQAPPPPREQKPNPPRFDLLGVVSDSQRAIAVLRRKEDGLHFRVEAGDRIDGWQVRQVEKQAVRIRWENGEEITLKVF